MSSPATIAVGDRKLYQTPQWPPSHRNRAFLVEKSVSRWGFLDKIAAICICLQSLIKEEIKGDRGLPVIISLASRPTFQTKTLIER